jgi:putative oxidoreductase
MLLLDILREILPAPIVLKMMISAFLAILFLQSGLDKVFNWQSELSWLKGHFSKTFLKDTVSQMLMVVMITEIAAGVLSALGFVEIFIYRSSHLSLLGAELSALNIVMLFFGQRIAKDYAGAATLVCYFVLVVLAIGVL